MESSLATASNSSAINSSEENFSIFVQLVPAQILHAILQICSCFLQPHEFPQSVFHAQNISKIILGKPGGFVIFIGV